ncbi:MAG: hypothetical protein JO056_12735 [Alphaproteobacteria bacterium]|nr:hypothetical protein [Alphaproteobacteria bacterium]
MLRVFNFFCFAVSAFACLALYHVSEQTRVARGELRTVRERIQQERQLADTLQAEWSRVADPSRLQQFAQADGAQDKPAIELSSTTQLPRRGDTLVADAEVRSASAVVTAPVTTAPLPPIFEAGR